MECNARNEYYYLAVWILKKGNLFNFLIATAWRP